MLPDDEAVSDSEEKGKPDQILLTSVRRAARDAGYDDVTTSRKQHFDADVDDDVAPTAFRDANNRFADLERHNVGS